MKRNDLMSLLSGDTDTMTRAGLMALSDDDFMELLSCSLEARMVASGSDDLYARMARIDRERDRAAQAEGA